VLALQKLKTVFTVAHVRSPSSKGIDPHVQQGLEAVRMIKGKEQEEEEEG